MMTEILLASLSDVLVSRGFAITERRQRKKEKSKEKLKHENEDWVVLEVVMKERMVEKWEDRKEIGLENEESL